MTTTTDEVVFPGPGEIDGFWALDKMHAPRPVTPLSFDLVVHPLAEGFTKAQAEYDCPVMVTTKEVNHFLYVAFHPLPDEAEIQRRLLTYHEKLATEVPKIGKTWEEEWKPAVIATNVPLKTADYSGLGDDELVAKLDELTDEMRHQWWIHGHINFVLLSSSAFCDLYDKVVQPSEPTESYQTLQGFHTRSVDAARGLWALSRVVKGRPSAGASCSPRPIARELPAALDASEEGRALRRQLDEFLFEFGWRHDAVFDLADVPWREDPTIPLASIASLVDVDDSEDPETIYRQRVARREELLANLRTVLADDPATLSKLDELYEAARYSFPLTEDHAFYIDQLFIGVFRRFALAVGQRLVDKGLVEAPDDVFYLYRDELVEALTDGGDRRDDGGRAAGQLRAGLRRHRADRARHAATAPGRPRPVHGRAGVPPPRHRAAGGEQRSERAQGGGRFTRRVHRTRPRRALPRRGPRRPRQRRGDGVRDDAAAVGADVLDRRRGRLRRGRRAVPQRDRGPRVRTAGGRRHERRHDGDQDRSDGHRRRHQGRRLPRRPRLTAVEP